MTHLVYRPRDACLLVCRSVHPPLRNDCMSDVEHNHMKQIPGSDNSLPPECSSHSDLLTKKSIRNMVY